MSRLLIAPHSIAYLISRGLGLETSDNLALDWQMRDGVFVGASFDSGVMARARVPHPGGFFVLDPALVLEEEVKATGERWTVRLPHTWDGYALAGLADDVKFSCHPATTAADWQRLANKLWECLRSSK